MFLEENTIKHEILFVMHLFSNEVSKLDKEAFKIILIRLMFINYKQHMHV